MSASFENYWESMEKQLNPSGMFFQDLHHCRFFRRSKIICKSGTLILKNSEIGSFSCQCSTIFIGQEKETVRFVQGGWLTLGPFRRSKLGMALRLGLLFGRNGPFCEVRGIKISTRDRRGTLISISFLGLSLPFGRSKNIIVWALEKPYKSRRWSTKKACCLIHLVSRICFSPKEKCTSQNAYFSKFWVP